MTIPDQTLAICFTNFGPYHYARLQALGQALADNGGTLLAYELAGVEEKYPWKSAIDADALSFRHVKLFPGRSVESLSPQECRRAIRSRLDLDQPTAIAAVGYVRPESMEMLRWAKSGGALRILLSESQKIDHPRVWWKEQIKSRRVRRFQAAVVGGPSHKAYLVELGMPAENVHLGYNAVGNAAIESLAGKASQAASLLPEPYFLSVCRFAPEKNLATLIHAYAAYVHSCAGATPWRLVLAGDGAYKAALQAEAESVGVADLCHWPGFLSIEQLVPWYVHAGAFVLPSRSEPWGLVVNEAALCGAPLLISDRCGCAATFVPPNGLPTGRTFDPDNTAQIAEELTKMAMLSPGARRILGDSARSVARLWGPERFAQGVLDALDSARSARRPVTTIR